MGKRKGRPPITETIPAEKIIRAYLMMGSARKAAKLLQTTHRTVARVLRDSGIEVNPPRTWKYREGDRVSERSGSFSTWVKAHGNEELPRSIKKLADLSGCTYQAVNCYLYRRRNPIRQALAGAPDLIDAAVPLESSNAVNKKGNPAVFNSRSFRRYRYEVDSYDLHTRIVAETDDYPKIVFVIEDPMAFVEKLRKVTKTPR